jgi:hypothetical protein
MKFTHVMGKKKRIENEDFNPIQKLHLNTCKSLEQTLQPLATVWSKCQNIFGCPL